MNATGETLAPSPHPTVTTITRLYRADWAPHIEQAVRAIATAAAFVYVCGYITGRTIHNLNDSLTALLVRKRGLTPEDRAMCLEVLATTHAIQTIKGKASTAPVAAQIRDYSLNDRKILQRCAVAAVPARCGIQSPMARAVSKVRGGMSQRQAATLCGVSRSSLQRALRG